MSEQAAFSSASLAHSKEAPKMVVRSHVLHVALRVSSQAHGDHPLRDTAIIAALADCAEQIAEG